MFLNYPNPFIYPNFNGYLPTSHADSAATESKLRLEKLFFSHQL